MFNIFKKKEDKKMENKPEGYVEDKELTVIENIEDLKEANADTGYLMEFESMGKGEDDEEEVTE